MKKLFTIAFSFILILALGGSLLAVPQSGEKAPAEKKATTGDAKEPTAKMAAKPKAHRASGKVVALSDKELKVEGKGKDAAKTWTFTLTGETDKPADLKEGSDVSVWYKKEGDQNVATKVATKAAKTKAKGAKKSTT